MGMYIIIPSIIIVVVLALGFRGLLKEISSKKCHDCDQDGNIK